jgi:hypothetical protein
MREFTGAPKRMFSEKNAKLLHETAILSKNSDDTGAYLEYIIFYAALENASVLVRDSSGEHYSIQNPIQNIKEKEDARTFYFYNQPNFDINKNLDDKITQGHILKDNLFNIKYDYNLKNNKENYLKNKNKK